jgi:hypothetical protein
MTLIVLVLLVLVPGVAVRGQDAQRPARHPAFEIDFANVK